jgi:predicted acyltransferase
VPAALVSRGRFAIGSSLSATASGKTPRLVSLDAFRGLTIAGMILVNNPGSWSHAYAPLLHSDWHGWTPTDLIFPFFLFIVGVSMVFSFDARLGRGETRGTLLLHVLRRSVIIFALGFFLAGFPNFNLATIRIPGVLQRIAVCYLLASLVHLAMRLRGQAITIGALLLGYWAVMTLVPVPGYGVGRLDVQGNLAAYVDRWLMLGHLWKPTWDPEGVLSTFPAVATVLLGALVGRWLASNRAGQEKARGLFLFGGIGLAAGHLWHLVVPITKNLWTSSYVVFTAGFACVLLGACYWLMDVKRVRAWAGPFVVFGMNAIAAFVLSSFVAKCMGIYKVTRLDGTAISIKGYVYQKFFAPLASPVNASLLFALSYVLFWLALMWLLYRRKIFIKI